MQTIKEFRVTSGSGILKTVYYNSIIIIIINYALLF